MKRDTVRRRTWLRGALATVATVAAIGGAAAASAAPGLNPAPTGAAPRLPVVASFSILGDLVRQVGGDPIDLQTLVGPDSDAHAVRSTPAMARTVAGAAVVFSNGLGFEGWMTRLLGSAGFRGRHVVVADDLEPRALAEGHGHGHGHDRDPHAWQDVAHARHFVARIAAGLCAADAAHCDGYRQRAAAADARLQALDREIRAAWAAVPPERRRVITSHDAFGYYGAAYGVQFLAPQGVSTEAEASARGVAALIRQIRAQDVRALFVENLADPRLIAQIGRETGVRPAGTLYADALTGPSGPAPTYEALMRHNTDLMVRAVMSR
jgi:zinc/manganese transport system substrate-binding protein